MNGINVSLLLVKIRQLSPDSSQFESVLVILSQFESILVSLCGDADRNAQNLLTTGR